MTEDPVEAAEWLRTYRHPMTELISIGPGRRTALQSRCRRRPAEASSFGPRALGLRRGGCRARLRGAAGEVSLFLRGCGRMDRGQCGDACDERRRAAFDFCDRSRRLRAEFEEEKRLRFTNMKTKEGAAKPRRILARWNVVKNLPKEARESIGNWSSDYAAEKVRQQVAWPVPPSMEVDFRDASSPATALRPRSSPRASARTTRSSSRAWRFTARSGATGRTAGGTSRRASCSAALETGPTTRSDWST